jgi:hypothetical protein
MVGYVRREKYVGSVDASATEADPLSSFNQKGSRSFDPHERRGKLAWAEWRNGREKARL